MRDIVRHRKQGYEAVSSSTTAGLAVEAAVALAAPGRVVTVTDETGMPVDPGDLAEQVRRAAEI